LKGILLKIILINPSGAGCLMVCWIIGGVAYLAGVMGVWDQDSATLGAKIGFTCGWVLFILMFVVDWIERRRS
jgi:hypothetical protein